MKKQPPPPLRIPLALKPTPRLPPTQNLPISPHQDLQLPPGSDSPDPQNPPPRFTHTLHRQDHLVLSNSIR